MHSQSDEVASTLRDTVSIAKRCLITEELSYLHASIANKCTKTDNSCNNNSLKLASFEVEQRLFATQLQFCQICIIFISFKFNISFLSHFVAIVANLHTFPFGAIPLGLF